MTDNSNTQVSWSGMDISLSGELTLPHVSLVLKEMERFFKSHNARMLTVNLNEVTRMDTSGVVLLHELRRQAAAHHIELTIISPENLQKTLETFKVPEPELARPFFFSKPMIFERIGRFFYGIGHQIHDFFYLVSDTFYYAIGNIMSSHSTRKGEFTNQLILIGMNALPIVGMISFLIGLILALQSAAQLRQFGAAIYVADLIAISMAREMGPIMTAIALAGRSGSAITSEIATMVVTEETDALRSMALNPIRYVLVPKFYAMTVAMPLLTILSIVIGIGGALVIGIVYLEIGLEPFLNQVVNALFLKDILISLMKSIIFAWLIVILAAFHGFRVRGGAAEVGKATTASVVSSIFAVILADSLIGLIFYMGKGFEI